MAIVFQTTFSDANCAEWTQADGLGDAAVCQTGDGIQGNGGWTASPGAVEDKITAAANMAAGGGGKGYRHAVGDGLNNVGGGARLSWSAVSEMWVRYYIRFQAGFAWGGGIINMKTIYSNVDASGTFYFGLHDGVVGGHIENDTGFGDPSGNHHSTKTWAQMQGGSTGDGLWHCLEIHTKMNPLAAVADGVIEFWLDGVLLYSNSGCKFATSDGATWSGTLIGENSNDPQNGGTVAFVDFDDIAVSDSGYIGPLSGGGGALLKKIHNEGLFAGA